MADDESYLRRAFDVARQSMRRGDHPFGAILVDAGGVVLIEAGNCFSSEGGDRTAHAERMLASQAKAFPLDVLGKCSMYVSAEPCAMCAGAIYWAGIGRVVYGQSEASLRSFTGNHPENPTLDLPCRTVFAAGQRSVEVVGPLLADEAADLQRSYWQNR